MEMSYQGSSVTEDPLRVEKAEENAEEQSSTTPSPIEKEINYIIEKEMPTKLENMIYFLSQFVALLNPQGVSSTQNPHGVSGDAIDSLLPSGSDFERDQINEKGNESSDSHDEGRENHAHHQLEHSKSQSGFSSGRLLSTISHQSQPSNISEVSITSTNSLSSLPRSESNDFVTFSLRGKESSIANSGIDPIQLQNLSHQSSIYNPQNYNTLLLNSSKRVKFRIPKVAAGRIELSGFKVILGKINIKTSNRTAPVMYTLSKPFVFHNLQKSHHLAVEALSRLEKISQQRARDHEANIPRRILLERMHHTLSELSRLLLQIKEHLESDFDMLSSPLRLQYVIPYEIVQRLQDNFTPKLPRDCLLEFSIQHAACYVTLYRLVFCTTDRMKDVMQKIYKPTNHISITMPDNKYVAFIQSIYRTEVIDNKYLQDAAIVIRNAYQTCSRLKDKLDQLKEFDV